MSYEVTIGIPVYNVERYIRRAMDSVLAQTFESIEFLVLDDCGTDDSIPIVREYQATHPRGKDIHIVRQPYNKGIGEARNRIIDVAQGRYLYFMDSDDSIAPRTIELMYKQADRFRAELVYGSHERVVTDDNGNTHHEAFQYESRKFLHKDDFAMWAYSKYDNVQAMVWNVLIDINIYRMNGLRHLPITYWEDFCFTMDLPTYVTRVVTLPDITYYYYIREGSLSNFQRRTYIEKREIESTIGALRFVKLNSQRISRTKYFPLRMRKVMTTCFYIVCNILRNEGIVTPPFNNSELRAIMRSPLTLAYVMTFKTAKWENLFFHLLGILPSKLSVKLMRLVAKKKHLV